MSEQLRCYRCGEALAALTLPISRRDMCPSCSVHLHVCRMCIHFDRSVPGQCREQGAEEVKEKERVNFCEWFEPNFSAFDPDLSLNDDRARAELEALFGADADAGGASDSDLTADAEKLFK